MLCVVCFVMLMVWFWLLYCSVVFCCGVVRRGCACCVADVMYYGVCMVAMRVMCVLLCVCYAWCRVVCCVLLRLWCVVSFRLCLVC